MRIEALTGVRIVSLAVNLPGPVAAMRLADLGADVTKVEPPAGDPVAYISPDWYARMTERQRVVTLDLKSDEGSAALHLLLADAHVLLTSHRPAALARLGLSWEDLTSAHPQLSQVAIVGQAGTLADLPGHDLTYQADSGLLGGPHMPRAPYADLAGAERAVGLVLAAVVGQRLHGLASYSEMPLEQVARDLAIPFHLGLTAADGVLGGGLAAYGIYATADGLIALAALEPHFQSRLADALGVTVTHAALAASFAERSTAEWVEWSRVNDIPLSAIR